MPHDPATQFTQLLHKWADGNQDARDQLTLKVYDTLRHIARKRMNAERFDHTFSGTDLVHEIWPQIEHALDTGKKYDSRAHFLNMCGQAMKHHLIDHAKARNAQKRGGEHATVQVENLDRFQGPRGEVTKDYILGIQEIEQRDEKLYGLATGFFLLGTSVEELSEMLGISTATVKRRLRLARARLQVTFKP